MSKVTEVKIKKRKGASEPAVVTKKTKVATDEETPKLKSALKKTASRTIVKDTPEAAPAKSTRVLRNRVEAPVDEPVVQAPVSNATEESSGKQKKTKATKISSPKETVVAVAKKTEKKETSKAANPERPTRKQKAVVQVQAEDSEEGGEGDEEDGIAIDDQTAALLAGFESSEDEKDPQDEGVSLDELPALPNNANVQKELSEAKKSEDSAPGVVYVGRIPHGFYEHQMRAYFSQFGEITHLRLSRNKLTGHSKHYAFLEFGSAAVADIVAKTMDKYLMFNHILQVRRIPAEQVHENLWKGEGKRFKSMPRNKIEGGLLRRGATREGWEKRVKVEEKRRSKKAKQLKDMGYEFEMPQLKSVGDVPVREIEEVGVAVVTDGDQVKVLEAERSEKPEAQSPSAPQAESEAAATNELTPVKRKKAGKESKNAKKVKTGKA